jgi:hypothetical protein
MKTLMLLALMLVGPAYANGVPEVPVNDTSSASAAANAAALAAAGAASRSNATGGDAAAIATGAGDSAAQNTTEVSTHYNQPRQVPTLVQGTQIVNDCGSGGNAGGAGTGGAGFLGFTWTTSRCYAFKTGNSFAAAGDYEMACELWIATNRRYLKKNGIVGVDCAKRAQALRAYQESQRTVVLPAPPAAPVDLGLDKYATKQELREQGDRILRTLGSK